MRHLATTNPGVVTIDLLRHLLGLRYEAAILSPRAFDCPKLEQEKNRTRGAKRPIFVAQHLYGHMTIIWLCMPVPWPVVGSCVARSCSDRNPGPHLNALRLRGLHSERLSARSPLGTFKGRHFTYSLHIPCSLIFFRFGTREMEMQWCLQRLMGHCSTIWSRDSPERVVPKAPVVFICVLQKTTYNGLISQLIVRLDLRCRLRNT